MSETGDAYESPPDGFPTTPVAYECPKCGQTVRAVPGPAPRMVDCPACEERLLIPAGDGSTELPDEREAPEARDARLAQELDGQRMRHLIVARRSAMRSRTHNVVAMVLCLIGAVKLVLMTVTEVRALGWHLRQISFVLFAAAALVCAVYFVQRAAHWGREAKGIVLPEPESAPDFSKLSDGSQHAKNLENLE